MHIRKGQPTDLQICTQVVQQAFSEDPFFRLVTTDEQWYLDLIASWVRCCFAVGLVDVSVRGNTIEGLYVLQPPAPGSEGISYIDQDLRLAGNPAYVQAFDKLTAEADAACHALSESAWYLAVIAVIPEVQGRGIGSRLLDNAWDQVTGSNGSTLTLTTNTEANCRFYTAHGFRTFSEITLSVGDHRLPNWSFRKDLNTG